MSSPQSTSPEETVTVPPDETGGRMSRLSQMSHLSSITSRWRFQKLDPAAAPAHSVVPGGLSQLNPQNKGSVAATQEPWVLIPKNSWGSYLVETLELHRGWRLRSTTLSRVKSNQGEQAGRPQCSWFCFPSMLDIKRLASHRSSMTSVRSNPRQIHTGWVCPGQQSPCFSVLCKQVVSIPHP